MHTILKHVQDLMLNKPNVEKISEEIYHQFITAKICPFGNVQAKKKASTGTELMRKCCHGKRSQKERQRCMWEAKFMRMGLLTSISIDKICFLIPAKSLKEWFLTFTKLLRNKPSIPLRFPLFHPFQTFTKCRITSPVLSVSSFGLLEMQSRIARNSGTTIKLN